MTSSGLKWRGSERFSEFYKSTLQNCRYAKFVLASLVYNAAYKDCGDAVLENCMVPIGIFAEKYCKRLGFLFIILVVGMVSFVNYVTSSHLLLATSCTCIDSYQTSTLFLVST